MPGGRSTQRPRVSAKQRRLAPGCSRHSRVRKPARNRLPQVVQAHRLGDVIIHARGDAAFPVSFQCLGSHCDNRKVTTLHLLPATNCSGGLKAIHLRHLTIHEYESKAMVGLAQASDSFPAICCYRSRMTQPDQLLQRHRLVGKIIFDHQYGAGYGLSNERGVLRLRGWFDMRLVIIQRQCADLTRVGCNRQRLGWRRRVRGQKAGSKPKGRTLSFLAIHADLAAHHAYETPGNGES